MAQVVEGDDEADPIIRLRLLGPERPGSLQQFLTSACLDADDDGQVVVGEELRGALGPDAVEIDLQWALRRLRERFGAEHAREAVCPFVSGSHRQQVGASADGDQPNRIDGPRTRCVVGRRIGESQLTAGEHREPDLAHDAVGQVFGGRAAREEVGLRLHEEAFGCIAKSSLVPLGQRVEDLAQRRGQRCTEAEDLLAAL